MLREIELSNLEVEDVTFRGGNLVQLWISESKTDPEAEGAIRTLQCVLLALMSRGGFEESAVQSAEHP